MRYILPIIKISCFAFLPKYGSTKGMVIDIIFAPNYESNKELSEASRKLGMYCSFISYDSYAEATDEIFRETLLDWGYFGRPDLKPKWML